MHYQIQFQTILPIKTISEANKNEHWSKKYLRNNSQKKIILFDWLSKNPKIKLPAKVIITRYSSKFLEDDNLPPALKHIRDVIADLIFPEKTIGKKWIKINGKRVQTNIPCKIYGRADASTELSWELKQEKGESQIKIEIISLIQ